MLISPQAFSPSELHSMIVRDPLIVKADTTVMEAIAQMSGVRAICDSQKNVDDHLEELHLEARSSCVLIVEDRQLLGILTERDIVRLSAKQCLLEQITVEEVMISPVISLQESALSDLFSTINLLQQHHIRHLPILDAQDQVVGIVTNESLRQMSRPVDLLRLRLVSEVMTKEVICATPDASMLTIVQLMANHRVSSVMIVQTSSSGEALQIPLGIITERDIVQFQALGLNLESYLAEAVMSTPIFAVKSTDSLWLVQQLMEQRLIRRLAVTGEQGELLGIVTQTSLLQALNPLEMYKMAAGLEQKVVQLEADKIALLENRTVELEQEVTARTIALEVQAEREKLVVEIATQIRSSLSLQTILDTTVEKIRQLLGCDRVNIWQFNDDWQTTAVAESTISSLSLLGRHVKDTCLAEQATKIFTQDRIIAVSDIFTTEMSACHRQMLINIETRAKILVPVFCGDKLWGLLNAVENKSAREWQPEEVELLQALSVHLAIAIQQATTHEQLAAELIRLHHTEAILLKSEQRYASLAAAAPVGIFRTDEMGNCLYVNDLWCQIAGITPEAAIGQGWKKRLYPEDRDMVATAWMQSVQESSSFQLEYRFQRPDGKVTWVYGQSVAERNADGQVVGYVGTITDISEQRAALEERQRAEEALQKSEAHQRALISAIPDLIIRMNRQGIFLEFFASPNFPVIGNLAEIVGTNVFTALPPEVARKRMKFVELALQTNSIQIYEQDLNLPWGIQIEEVRVVPAGKDEVVILVRDVSERQAMLRERQQAQEALQKSEAHQRALMQAIPDLMMRIDRHGVYLEFIASSYDFHIFGTPSTIVGDTLFNTMPADLAQKRLDSIHVALATNTIQIYEQEFPLEYGIQVEEVRIVPYSEDEALVLVREISEQQAALQERKQAELALQHSEAHQRALISAIPDLMMRLDRQGMILEFIPNSSNLCIVGRQSGMAGTSIFDNLPTELAQKRLEYVQIALDTNSIQLYEQQLPISNKIQTEEVRIVPYGENEVLLLVRDVSEQQAALQERQQAALALKQSEAHQKALMRAIPDLMMRIDRQGIFLECVATSYNFPIAGDPLEMVGSNVFAILPHQEAQRRLDYIQLALDTNTIQVYEQEFQIENGIQTEEVRMVPYGENEVLLLVRDVSDRKQAEANLIQSEAQSRTILSVMPDYMFRVGVDGIYRSVVSQHRGIDLLKDFDPIGLSMMDLLPPEVANRQLHYVQQAVGTGQLQIYEQQLWIDDPAGEDGYQRLQYEEVRVIKSGADEALIMIRDISDRKQAEVALIQSEAQNRAILEAIPDFMFRMGADGVYRGFVTGDREINLFNRQINPTGLAMIDVLPLEVAYRHLYYLEQALSTGELQVYEQQIEINGRLQDEEVRVVKSSEDEALFMIRDISEQQAALRERKEAEAALLHSQEQLSLVLKGSNDGWWDWNLIDAQVYYSPRWWTILGYEPGEVVDDPELWKQLIHQEDLERVNQYLEQQLNNGVESYEVEFRLQHKQGHYVPLISRGYILRDNQGKPIRVSGTNTDVTELKQAEQRLLQLNQDLEIKVLERTQELSQVSSLQQAILNGADYSIISSDVHGIIQTFNAAAERMLGYTAAEVVGKLTPAIIHDRQEVIDRAVVLSAELGQEILPGFEVFVAQARQGMISETEWTYIHKDGSRFPVLLSVTALKDPQQQIIGFLGIAQDISERKRAEAELQKLSDRLAVSLKSGAIGCWEWDIVQNTILWDERMYELYGVTKANNKSLVYDIWANGLHPDDRLPTETLLHQATLGLAEYDTEFRVVHPDGSIHFIKAYGVLVRDSQGEAHSIIGINFDITDRKHAEQENQHLRERLQFVMATSPAVIFTCKAEGDYGATFVSENVYEVTGYTVAEFLAESSFWADHIHPDDVTQILAEFPQILERGYHSHEYRFQDRDGYYLWMRDELRLVRDEQGNPKEIVGYFADITDRKQAEETIRSQAEREILLREITQKIRQYLDLQIIFDTACQEIRQVIKSDRVGIFKFYPESNFDDGEFVAESVVAGYPSVMQVQIHDHCFGENYSALYAEGRFHVADDIYNNGMTTCHIDVLSQFEVRASMIMPLLCGHELWGLLCVHQCGGVRYWQQDEINFTQQLANQLAIAIQQANLYKQIQAELQVRQQAEANIAFQLRQQKNLGAIVQKTRESLDINEILTTVTPQIRAALGSDRVIIFQLFNNGHARIVEESVSNNFSSLKNREWDNEVWSPEILDYYLQGQPRIVADVMDDVWTDCLVEYSCEGHILSKIVAPILQDIQHSDNYRWTTPSQNHRVWGILVVHACQEKRVWQDSEAQLLQQIANQLAIAIQQANLFEQLQQQLTERQQAETRLTETNQQLAISNDELARATRLKDEFLANMSHELRTPLNAILGMTEGLEDEVFGSVNQQQVKALKTIERSGSHLLELINDILDVAKIESGQVELERSSVEVDQLCQSSMAFIKQQALKKGIQFETKLPQQLPNLLVDERRIRQVLINLLNNAVKFTPDNGRISLEVTQLPPAIALGEISPQSFLRIAIIDTGIGISSENIQKLFQPFMQIDSALNRQYNGTGLGLALVKRIVELHGGRVGLTSELGVGSCFSIELPCIYNASQPISSNDVLVTSITSEISPVVKQNPLILLADDNEANISTFSGYLGAKGYRIIIAKTGLEAIDLAKAHQPELILMDIQMPEMDGLEAIKQICLDPNLVNTPIIALTALTTISDQTKCLEAGAKAYLPKPVKLKQLTTTIQRLLDGEIESSS